MTARMSFAVAVICVMVGAATMSLIAATSTGPFVALVLFAYVVGCVPALLMLFFAAKRIDGAPLRRNS
jgi:hypothetical protein